MALKIHLITGSVLLAVSFLMKIWPPKKINHWYGYRTPASMKNQINWDMANGYSADLMMWAGITNLLVQAAAYTLVDGEVSILISLGYYVGFILISIILVEKRLKSTGS